MNYQQFLTSMSGVGNTPPLMQQQQQQSQQQHMPNAHPHFQQQQQQQQHLPPQMQHQQHQQHQLHQQHQQQGLPRHLPQQHPHPQHQHQHQQPLHEMLPLSLPPHLHQQPAMVMGMPAIGPNPSPSQYSSLGFYTGFPEPLMYNAQKSQRHRRKSAPGVEHVKHRRTRSGCYTCRSRRIKCDEGRPSCERCKKGKRECIYPDPNSSKSAAAAAAAAAAASGTSSTRDTPTPSQQASPDTSNEGDDDDTEQESKLGTIVDDDEAELTDTAEMAIKEEGGSSKSYQFTATINERPQPPLRHSGSVPYMNPKRSNTGPFGTGGSIGTPRRPRQDSETPSLDGKGSSPATSTGTGGSFPLTSHSIASSDAIYTPSGSAPGLTPADWSHLPQDIRFFLGYFCDNITHFHYCMPIDYDSFIHSLLLSLAIRNEPLLYAVVAFSSYHYILRDPTAKLQQFLQYYDQSVRLLLGVLKRKEPHSLGTLLTVLQLATIEEYLGDWINLMGHQKAALEMITDIYMPDSIVQTPIGRAVSHWYSRFDVFVGIMGGFPTGLPRVWLTSLVDYYKGCIANDPNNVVLRIEECSSSLRLISYEMSMLFARAKDDGNGMSDDPAGSGGGLASFPSFAPDETFIREHARILNDLHEWKKVLDAIVDIDIGGEGASPGQHPYLVTDFSHAKPLVESDIVDPYQPGQLYYGPLFGVTIMSCDWESIVVMHELQAAQLAIAAMGAPEGPSSIPEGVTLPEGMSISEAAAAAAAGMTVGEPSGEAAAAAAAAAAEGQQIAAKMSAELAGLAKRAYKICQMFEQLEMWPASPPGSLIISQSKLAMATLFLPRDQRHHMWIRRKFALIETMGYIFPVTTRTRMAELFNDPACTQWWLPNNEGFSPILQSVRAFADERNATAVSAQNENLREIRHIFGKLQIGEGSKDKDKDNDAASEGGYSIGGSVEGSVKGKSIQGSKGGRDSRQTKGTKGKGV